jgi:SAM-dependent methyltransferase
MQHDARDGSHPATLARPHGSIAGDRRRTLDAAGGTDDSLAAEPGGFVDAEGWNDRYRAAELVWGAEPNRFVAEVLGPRAPAGRALDLACGEGRNAIWLARRGWQVVGVDFSEVALERARKLAAEAGVEVEWVHADVATYPAEPEAFALVLVSYLQVPGPERRAMLGRAAAALAPGGELLLIGHALRNRTEGVGGPQQPSVLWDPETLATELRAAGLRVERCEEVLRPVEVEGEARSAIDVLAEAHRPSSPA